MYKLGWDTSNLRIADVNGDGLEDIVVVNNARARIECLLQRPKAQPPPPLAAGAEGSAKPDVNEIPNDSRFENRPYLTEKRIFSLELGDLNGHGRTDMAYYGDPRELVVVPQDANGQWGPRQTFDIPDGSTQPGALAIGDLTGSGRNDLVLLGTDGTYFIHQDAAGQLRGARQGGGPAGRRRRDRDPRLHRGRAEGPALLLRQRDDAVLLPVPERGRPAGAGGAVQGPGDQRRGRGRPGRRRRHGDRRDPTGAGPAGGL